MLRAVFVRTLKPGVTDEQFLATWTPEDMTDDPVRVSVSRDLGDDRPVITILELDGTAAEFAGIRSSLFRPDALERLGGIVERTEAEGLFDEVFTAGPAAG
ncbi:MAG: hypothetical protein S0880_07550 [Actinomycetota bacterium]|nr:hypothetical protein [Actinomycetota bacterium]